MEKALGSAPRGSPALSDRFGDPPFGPSVGLIQAASVTPA